ncbi:hypothetical protein N5U55_03045 [Aliarcobacter butzleri]|uniref:hypothetical protein n=1 Tax=Aliarcobacter butzleri TaxID=28197 RepID=UPI0021B17FEA|nr:hypothetical protein [Aliarcobacter butzleri]MCT7583089.1 hypothetical protein [Aliarcobacter butzleri]
MYINKLDEIIKEFKEYDYLNIEEIEEDKEKIIIILSILEKKEIALKISNFDFNE